MVGQKKWGVNGKSGAQCQYWQTGCRRDQHGSEARQSTRLCACSARISDRDSLLADHSLARIAAQTVEKLNCDGEVVKRIRDPHCLPIVFDPYCLSFVFPSMMKSISMVLFLPILWLSTAGAEARPPEPGPLDAKYRVKSEKQPIYELGDQAILLPSRKWIVVPLNHCRELKSPTPGPGGLSNVGVVAVDVATGQARQLINLSPHSEPNRGFWECSLVTLGDNRCGVVFFDDAYVGCEATLWQWDLETNKVTSAGRWPVGLLGLLDVIEPSQRQIVPDRVGDEWTGTITIKAGADSTQFTLEPCQVDGIPKFALSAYAAWFAPASQAGSFLVLQSPSKGCAEDRKPTIECVDSAVKGGRRWRLSEEDLRRMTGASPQGMAPLLGQNRPSKRVVIAYEGARKSESLTGHGYLILDTSNGKLVKFISLRDLSPSYNPDLSPDRDLLPSPNPVLSPDGRYAVYRCSELASPYELLRVIDLEKQTWQERQIEPVPYGLVSVFGFLDATHFLTCDLRAIQAWSLDLKKDEPPRDLFRLMEQ